MRWLIVEDALRDRKGHWFEYVGTFERELRALGDDVTILADKFAEPFLIEQLKVQPILPASIWHRMGDGSGALRRYLRVPGHALKIYRAVKKFLQSGEKFDVIFVPTVLVHHLLGWTWLIKRVLKKNPARVLLFFPNTPVNLENGQPSWQSSPTAKLFCRLVHSLRKEVQQGRVMLGAETYPMQSALTQLTGVPFTYFPHPISLKAENRKQKVEETKSEGRKGGGDATLIFGSYGSARHEKGSDILVPAVEEFCRRHPESNVQFVLQSVDGEEKLWARLKGNSKVLLIPNYFADGEYARQLAQTDVLLLPYRRSSYSLRVSRVVIEAMTQGMPVVVTHGTTLAEQAAKFGSPVFCEDENVDSLVAAMETAVKKIQPLKASAERNRMPACGHFSVREFRNNFLSN